METAELITAGIHVATVFSALSLFIYVFYPALARILWQKVLVKIWPEYAQMKNPSRYSYMSVIGNRTYFQPKLTPVPIKSFLWAGMNGFSLGVLLCYWKELVGHFLIAGVMIWFCWRVFVITMLPKNSLRVDILFKYARELALVLALFFALGSAGLLK